MTAKKRKADMVTGDLVNMVGVMSAQQKADQEANKKKKKIYPKALGLVQ